MAANTAEVRLNGLRALIALPGETMADLARRGHQRLREFLQHNELTGFRRGHCGPALFPGKQARRGRRGIPRAAARRTHFRRGPEIRHAPEAMLAKNRMARVEELRPAGCCGCSTPAPAKWPSSTAP